MFIKYTFDSRFSLNIHFVEAFDERNSAFIAFKEYFTSDKKIMKSLTHCSLRGQTTYINHFERLIQYYLKMNAMKNYSSK